jgi:hypothetical protein
VKQLAGTGLRASEEIGSGHAAAAFELHFQ